MIPDDLTPEDRIIAMDQLMVRYLALKCPKGTRRKADHGELAAPILPPPVVTRVNRPPAPRPTICKCGCGGELPPRTGTGPYYYYLKGHTLHARYRALVRQHRDAT